MYRSRALGLGALTSDWQFAYLISKRVWRCLYDAQCETSEQAGSSRSDSIKGDERAFQNECAYFKQIVFILCENGVLSRLISFQTRRR